MKVLVTGASGFVGGAFARRFGSVPGLEIHGVARRATDLPRYHRRDLSRPFALELRPDVVLHAAALASPWGSPAAFERHVVEATRRVVDFCESCGESSRGGPSRGRPRDGRPRLIHVSSTSVFYTEGHQHDLTEDSPIGPRFLNRYAAAKAASERVVAGYSGEAVVVRPRAVFGPGDTVLFPRVLRAARLGRLPLFSGTTETVIADLVGIETLCDYLLAVARHPSPAPAYNLTNAEPVALEALLLDVLDRLELPRPTRRVPVSRALAAASALERLWRWTRLPGEPPATRFGVATMAFSKTFDVSRQLEDLGPPSVSLADGIERFVRWRRERAT